YPLAHGPTHLTILPTYRCTAACAQCCFESNPHVQGRIPIERILDYIDQAAGDFPSLRLVVFSGGECFLLRRDLDAAIERATSRGLATRCVTNGYWATSPRAARERILSRSSPNSCARARPAPPSICSTTSGSPSRTTWRSRSRRGSIARASG